MQNESKQNFKTCNNLSERTTAASEEEADAKPRDDGLSLWQALVYISTYDQLQLDQASISQSCRKAVSFSIIQPCAQYQISISMCFEAASPLDLSYPSTLRKDDVWCSHQTKTLKLCSLRSWRNPLPKVGQAYDRHLLGSWRSTSHQMRNMPGQRGQRMQWTQWTHDFRNWQRKSIHSVVDFHSAASEGFKKSIRQSYSLAFCIL